MKKIFLFASTLVLLSTAYSYGMDKKSPTPTTTSSSTVSMTTTSSRMEIEQLPPTQLPKEIGVLIMSFYYGDKILFPYTTQFLQSIKNLILISHTSHFFRNLVSDFLKQLNVDNLKGFTYHSDKEVLYEIPEDILHTAVRQGIPASICALLPISDKQLSAENGNGLTPSGLAMSIYKTTKDKKAKENMMLIIKELVLRKVALGQTLSTEEYILSSNGASSSSSSSSSPCTLSSTIVSLCSSSSSSNPSTNSCGKAGKLNLKGGLFHPLKSYVGFL